MPMQTLSAANIRYLIALNALDREGGVRCVDIAQTLGITKPSVHRMMEAMCDMALIVKAKYGTVSLTETGRALAESYAAYYTTIGGYFAGRLSLTPDEAGEAALALLAAVPGERAEHICGILRGLS